MVFLFGSWCVRESERCVRDLVRPLRLLRSFQVAIENNDGRGDNVDGVLYRVDWLYNCLVRCVGSYNIDENIVRQVGRSRDMLEEIVRDSSIQSLIVISAALKDVRAKIFLR